MEFIEFSHLNDIDKLSTIKQAGILQTLFTLDIYQFSLYKVDDYYVEVRTNMNRPHLVSVLEMSHEELPNDYKIGLKETIPQLDLVV